MLKTVLVSVVAGVAVLLPAVVRSSNEYEVDEPQQIHLSLAGVSGSVAAGASHQGMRVNWYTEENISQHVLFGASEHNISFSASEEEHSPRQYLSGHGYHHVAMINCADAGLLGGWVYYKVGSATSKWSDIFKFDTRPWSPNATTTVSIFGDLGYENSTYRRTSIEASTEEGRSPDASESITLHWSATWTRDTIVGLADRGAIDAVIHLGDIGCEC